MDEVVVLPLYPHFSISTSGSSFRELQRLREADPAFSRLPIRCIRSWYDHPGYVLAMAELIAREVQECNDPTTARIFFSAHGVPKSYVEEAGDPYQQHIEACTDLIMTELARQLGHGNPFTLAYQSRVGPVEWLQPYTDEALVELGEQGVKELVVVPISFVSEHIETLEEIDIEYREIATEAGITTFRRVPALDTYLPHLHPRPGRSGAAGHGLARGEPLPGGQPAHHREALSPGEVGVGLEQQLGGMERTAGHAGLLRISAGIVERQGPSACDRAPLDAG